MHPLRAGVRKELFSILDSSYLAKLRAYYNTINADFSSWASYALLTNGPPDFKLQRNFKDTVYSKELKQTMKGFSPILAEFYTRGKISTLWAKYRSQFQALSDKHKPYAYRAIYNITQYCRLDSTYFSHEASKIYVISAPLQSYFTAFTENINNEIFLVFGPQIDEPGTSSFYHEALHHVITPLTNQLDSNAINRFSELFKLASSDGHIGYSHIDEAFVRTLGIVIYAHEMGLSDSLVYTRIKDEYKLGFILCFAICEQLKGYENSKMSLAQYFPKIISGIDPEKEKRRWHTIITDSNSK